VQQYGGGAAAVLPEIQVPEAHDIHVPAPVAPAFPVRRLPASVYVPEQQQQQQTDFELFNALNPHRARKPALGKRINMKVKKQSHEIVLDCFSIIALTPASV
jgi:hypothetical protein